jgi:hypothetical protein
MNQSHLIRRFLFLIVVLTCCASAFGQVFELITEDEAKLPDATPNGHQVPPSVPPGPLQNDDPVRNTPYQHPRIEIVGLKPGPVRSPIDLVVNLVSDNSLKVNMHTLEFEYLKASPVQLLGRITRERIGDQYLDLKGAKLPPGKHWFRIAVKDSARQPVSLEFPITVAP